jgi:hypothetical protein
MNWGTRERGATLRRFLPQNSPFPRPTIEAQQRRHLGRGGRAAIRAASDRQDPVRARLFEAAVVGRHVRIWRRLAIVAGPPSCHRTDLMLSICI